MTARMLAQAVGGPAQLAEKLRRAAVTVALLADPRALAARCERLRARGYVDRMQAWLGGAVCFALCKMKRA